ncbi:MAG TPA: hypothetical protein VLV83_22325 [Acidobacteriota bacterium]|nr:hypothetical protein [Acidobacteriota bacterium]
MTSFRRNRAALIIVLLTSLTGAASWIHAGIRDALQDQYRAEYLNKTYFLKIPLYGARYEVMVRSGGLTPYDTANNRLTFKVGEQVRVVKVEFGGQEIRFEVASIDLARENELVYRFPIELSDDFAQRQNFEDALDQTFTVAMSNREIEAAKRTYLRREFTRVIQEMADTTQSDRGFVISAVSDEIPDVERAKQRARRSEEQLEEVRSQLDQESQRRQRAETDLRDLRGRFNSSESAVDDLKSERDALQRDKDELESQLRRLRESNQEYQRQVEELAETLDVRTNDAQDLNRSLSRLNETIESLKAERDRLSQELSDRDQQLEEKTQEAETLNRQLTSVRSERNRLRSNLRDLTSDKDSLNSRYVAAKDSLETFETAQALGQALSLRTLPSSLSGEGPVVRALFLNNHKIAQFEIEEPQETGRLYGLRVSVDSPDTVAFSEEERRLYSALGDSLTVMADYSTSSEDLTAVLAQGQSKQSIAARESAEWQFNFSGSLDQAVQAVLSLSLETAAGRSVPLSDQTFVMGGGGLLGLGGQPFSLLWLIAGAALGILLMLPVLFLRSRKPAQPRKKTPSKPSRPKTREPQKDSPADPPSYVPHKKL